MPNKLIRMARQLLIINEDLPCRLDYARDRRISVDDFEIYIFEQTWGSTSLGFGGIGGQTITSENTYVFVPLNCDQKCFIYFGSKFAYEVEWSDVLMQDVLAHKVEPVNKHRKYNAAANKV